jgi:hypothetical protein
MKHSGVFPFALGAMLALAGGGPVLARSVAPRAAVPVDATDRILEALSRPDWTYPVTVNRPLTRDGSVG